MALKTLTIDLKVGQTIQVSGPAAIKLESKSGTQARLAVMADESVAIDRPSKDAGGHRLAQQGTKKG